MKSGKRFENHGTLALGAMALALALAPAARAQTGAEFNLMYYSVDGTLFTPNPFPPYVSISQGGQLVLNIDTTPDQPPEFYLTSGEFHPAFGGNGLVFVE